MLNRIQTVFKKVLPEFLSHKPSVHLASFYTFSNFTRIWAMTIFSLTASALLPLWFAAVIHHNLIQQSMDSELRLRAERLTSNARRSIAFFMEERLNALTFTVNEIGYGDLTSHAELDEILRNLKLGFGGFSDLSIINADGRQVAYAGPYNLEGKNYKHQPWFAQSMKQEHYISEVFTGYRDEPHIIIAVRSWAPGKGHFVLRATLDTARLIQTIQSYQTSIHADLFLVNHEGVLQTPSSTFGEIFSQTDLEIPEVSPKTEVVMNEGNKRAQFVKGYSFVSTDTLTTPFILMVMKKRAGVMEVWLRMGSSFNWIIGISGVVLVIIVTLASTFLVNRLYHVDDTKAKTMLQMEESQQLAAIGQLAAGVAHEINNPLALINETAGYVKDLYAYGETGMTEEEIIEHLDSILEAVDRCGTITSQLLGFVRRFDIKIKKIDIGQMVSSVLSFHKKDAEHRGIHVTTIIPDTLPLIETDSGKLQQILVNLINNAFQAVEEDGCLDIVISQKEPEVVDIEIKDTGCGISEENLKKIHEPFFSTKQEKMGTGLGLSITYGLVKKLKGRISVKSTEGVGTEFTISLPVKLQEEANS